MPALTPLTGESLASVVPEGLDDTANSADASPKRGKKKQYGFGKRFAYQRLRGYRPILSAHSAEIFFLTVGTLLLALGIPILIASLNVKTYSVRYDDAGPMAAMSSDDERQTAIWAAPDGISYSLDIQIEEKMEPPIYVVYQLEHVYQNYRRYVRSYDPDQMHDGSSIPGIAACAPFQYETAGDEEDPSMPENGAILPCGQIAHSNFNDTFSLSVGDTPLALDESSIAWSSDADHLYGDVSPINYNVNPALRGGNTSTMALNQDQHWMVWMRPGGQTPNLQKLYGRIDEVIPAGTTVSLAVNNRYNTYSFSGAKSIILTTNSWMGGKNTFLPIAYLVVAGLSYALALAFFLGYDLGMVWKRKPGVTDDFSWVRHSRSSTPLPASPVA